MQIELKVPALGESINEVEIGEWLKAEGEAVQKDQPLVALESEKATVELPAPETGSVKQVLKRKGDTAKVGEVIALFQPDKNATASQAAKGGKAASESAGQTAPAAQTSTPPRVMPAAEVLLAQHKLKPTDVEGTGPGGRILKEDVLRHVSGNSPTPGVSPAPQAPTPSPENKQGDMNAAPSPSRASNDGIRQEESVPMSRLRRTIAERLVQAQHSGALLTTFNEIDMGAVMELRKQHGEAFQQRYQVKLGFMSFFVKACIDGLKLLPALNAEIRGTNILYRNYFDIGVAIGGGKGLVVPVIRNAERLSFAEIEMAIGEYARRAKENKLKLEELQGGTFTISNGGVYGSLLSTPIINPPQSGVLGLHAIQERPVAREGAVVIRPMMYIALTYDHRLVDGREAVSFLRRVKEVMETPTRMLMEI